jgi:hypothetical protein
MTFSTNNTDHFSTLKQVPFALFLPVFSDFRKLKHAAVSGMQ